MYIDMCLKNKNHRFRELNARLHDLNPAEILKRGYSIARTIPDAVVVVDSKEVCCGQNLEVILAKGSLICRVERKSDND
jgi:exodeoxyribonuclease VII large subunit